MTELHPPQGDDARDNAGGGGGASPGVPVRDIPAHIDKLQDQVRRYEREIEQLKLKMAQAESASAADSVMVMTNARNAAG